MIALIILVAIPLIEIAVLIKVGQWIGFWPAIGIVVATFMLGAAILSRSGFTAALRLREAMARGEPPVAAMLDSSLVVFAAVLLMTPGFVADAVGLALLIPPVRTLLASLVLRNFTVVGNVQVDRTTFEARVRPANDPGEPPTRASRPDIGAGPVIDGEFERLDERPPGDGSGKPRGDPPRR